jgi:hypothetical protein
MPLESHFQVQKGKIRRCPECEGVAVTDGIKPGLKDSSDFVASPCRGLAVVEGVASRLTKIMKIEAKQ